MTFCERSRNLLANADFNRIEERDQSRDPPDVSGELFGLKRGLRRLNAALILRKIFDVWGRVRCGLAGRCYQRFAVLFDLGKRGFTYCGAERFNVRSLDPP